MQLSTHDTTIWYSYSPKNEYTTDCLEPKQICSKNLVQLTIKSDERHNYIFVFTGI